MSNWYSKPRHALRCALGLCLLLAMSPFSLSQTRYPRPITIAGKWGYIDVEGKIVISAQYLDAQEFSEGLALVKLDDSDKRLAFIDRDGKVVIRGPKHSVEFGPFSDGVFFFRYTGDGGDPPCGFSDQEAKITVTMTNRECFDLGLERLPVFVDGITALNHGSKAGYINKTGQRIGAQDLDSAADSSQGLARVSKFSRYGFVSAKDGRQIIEPKFLKAADFSEGLAAVSYTDQGTEHFGFIDTVGTIVMSSDGKGSAWRTFDDYGFSVRFSGGLALVKDPSGNLFYINHDGKEAFSGRFGHATSFTEGFAIANEAIIDKEGRTIATLGDQVMDADAFSNGLSKITFRDGTWGYADQAGKLIWQSH